MYVKKPENGQRIRKKRIWILPATAAILLCLAFLIYAERYYHSDESAYQALKSDETVTVKQTGYGWLFDGPSEDNALIFYPGAKVEETAYAPLLHQLAGRGMDVCLVRMPFRLAVFGANKANYVMAQHDYARWYIGGHSLGGVMAASYAAAHSSRLAGVFLLASYPSRPLNENTRTVVIYGDEDGVLNRKRLEKAYRYLPADTRTYVIQGGNHAQFGNYGKQSGDGEAGISSGEQQLRTVDLILQNK